MANKHISCEQYDYIEIVCMHNYPIRLSLKNGTVIDGIAVDTKLNSNRDECIQLSHEGSEQLVVLVNITHLAILIDNPHFTSIAFNN